MSENVPSPSASIPDKEAIAKASQWVRPLRDEVARVLVGQTDLVDRLLVALLTYATPRLPNDGLLAPLRSPM